MNEQSSSKNSWLLLLYILSLKKENRQDAFVKKYFVLRSVVGSKESFL